MLSDHPVALELELPFEILGVPQLVEGDWKELWMGRWLGKMDSDFSKC